MSKAIILFSHGSVLCGSGENLSHIARAMQARGDAGMVEAGYLNYSQPPFEETFQRCVDAGARDITVVPFFLVAGYFVKRYVSPKIAAMQARYPEINVREADALRAHPLLADALLSCAQRAAPPEEWRNILKTAPAFCQSRPDCPLYNTPLCPRNAAAIPKAEARESAPLPSKGRGEGVRFVGGSSVTALLVLVHGSPNEDSNTDMYHVVEMVRLRAIFPIVEVGFMECNEPDIPKAIATCVEKGAQRVIAVPYFLHTGRHVADDLPTHLEAAREEYPGVEFLMGDYIGHDPLIMDALRERASEVEA